MAKKNESQHTPQTEDAVAPRETWTVNGLKVSDMDPALQTQIFWAMTDQAAAIRDKRPRVPRIEVLSGPFERNLERMEGDLEYDPYREAVAPYEASRPDLQFRMLSPRVCAKRSLRGYEPVLDEAGERVKVGDMFLGAIPRDVAAARNVRRRNLDNEALGKREEEYAEMQEKFIREARGQGLSVLRSGEMITDERDPSRVATSGLQHTRGQ
jgi:hypothetical protein